jgi:hypothetical protein
MFSAIFLAVAPRPAPFPPAPDPEGGELPACAGLNDVTRAVGEAAAACSGDTAGNEGAGVMLGGRRGASKARVDAVEPEDATGAAAAGRNVRATWMV